MTEGVLHNLEYARDITFVDDAALRQDADKLNETAGDSRNRAARLFVHFHSLSSVSVNPMMAEGEASGNRASPGAA